MLIVAIIFKINCCMFKMRNIILSISISISLLISFAFPDIFLNDSLCAHGVSNFYKVFYWDS